MTQADDRREPPSLGEIVREKTNDGLTILDFYIGAFEGELDGSTAPNRLEAAQDLLDMIVDHALLRRRWQGTALAIVLGSDLDLFRRIVRFQVDVVEGREEGLTLRRRVLLAEQLRNCLALVDAAAAAGRFSKIFRQEAGDGGKIDSFLRDVAGGKLDGTARDDRRSARKLLDDKGYLEEFVPCKSHDCSVDWRTSILSADYVSQALDDAHMECGCSDDD